MLLSLTQIFPDIAMAERGSMSFSDPPDPVSYKSDRICDVTCASTLAAWDVPAHSSLRLCTYANIFRMAPIRFMHGKLVAYLR